jgi:hypothetical protein
MLIAPIPTAGPILGNLWFAQLRSAKHVASNVSDEPGLAPGHNASTGSSTRYAPTAATRLTAQGLVKWPSSIPDTTRLPGNSRLSLTPPMITPPVVLNLGNMGIPCVQISGLRL